jgi:hypothetical protein
MGDYLVYRRKPVAKVQPSGMDKFLNALGNLEKFGLIARVVNAAKFLRC